MNKTKLLTLLVLLMTAASGAWATDPTTHVVTNANVNTIFSGGGYTLGNAVKAGDVLDFQGEIDLQHSLIVNKQVNIISSKKDAVVKLNTPTTVAPNAYTATVMYPQSFVINKAGSGTTVQDIRIENTETWLYNTSNVTFTGVTMWVEEARIGYNVGQVAIRYSDHVTFDGCTVYAKNNGGNSGCTLTGSHDCTFKDTRFEAAGAAGNILYIGNPYYVDDKPADYTMNNDNISVLNCTITAESSGAMSQFKIMDGLRHRIENCTVNFITNFFCAATASEDGFVIRNNTFTHGLSIPRASTFTGNSVTGNVTISVNNATVSGTTVNLGSTITGNSILGKVTFGSSKNNTFTGNTVISSETYAVVMGTTKDANNTVQNNVLLAASNAGDAAVNLNNGTGNTISNNLAEAATGDVTWNFDATTGTLTIGGTGAMADYDQTTAPWAFLSDKITRVIIGEGVTKVGSNAFQGCTALNDVFVKGAGTLTIGPNAFDTSATFNIYVPSGKETAYKLAWSDYASKISEYMSCGTDASAVYDAATHTLTICGSGAMTDFASAADQPWKALQGELQQVVFEATITNIGTNAFANCSALTTANILGTATTIADGSFNGNATSRRIIVPVKAIGNYGESTYAADIYATGQCGATGSEGSVTWELNAKTLALVISGTGAMTDYANANSVPWYSVSTLIKTATIAEGVTTIGKYAFRDCSNMATVSIPEGVTTIGNYAFAGCSVLETVSIPATVTSLGTYAFYSCTGMATVSLPEGLTTIGEYAFNYCSALETVSIPATVTTIEGCTFRSCSKLESVSIPSTVTTIRYGAFQNCSALTAIVIPEGVTLIDEYTFANCSELKDVTIPYGVTTINRYAFRSCSKLESITIPASVTSVGNQAFLDCSLLTEVYVFATSLPTCGTNAFTGNAAGRMIYVPAGTVDTYKAANGWKTYAEFIAEMPITDVTLTDGQGITAFDNLKGKPGAVTYQRSFTSGTASTVCLPFAYVKKTGEAFYTFSGITKNGDEYVADMTEVTTAALTANKPYLFMPSATGNTDFSGTYAIPATLEAGSVTKGDWTFQGTYETIEWTTAPTGIYGFSGQAVGGISQGQFVKVGAYVRISPMRCYLKYKNGSADYAGARSENGTNDEVLPETIKVRLISANGTVTAIGSLSTKTGEVTLDNDAWYSLDGRRVANPAKGVYVKNGRKVVIK